MIDLRHSRPFGRPFFCASYCDAAVVVDASALSFAAVVLAAPLSFAASIITVRVDVAVLPQVSVAM